MCPWRIKWTSSNFRVRISIHCENDFSDVKLWLKYLCNKHNIRYHQKMFLVSYFLFWEWHWMFLSRWELIYSTLKIKIYGVSHTSKSCECSQIIIIMCTINSFVPRPKFSNIVFRETFEYDIHDIVIIIDTYDMRIIFVSPIFLTKILSWTENQAV